MNAHYAEISTDSKYSAPLVKSTSLQVPIDNNYWPSEYTVFTALDKLQPTATAAEGVRAWFLRLSAPVIARPLAYLFYMSVNDALVPTQWKTAHITPVAKVNQPKECADFRPISVMPVLSRVLEKLIVRDTIYPTIQIPKAAEALSDQFAFRPTGSTTAALIAILTSISDLSTSHPDVHIVALYFSKAFDTVRHSILA